MLNEDKIRLMNEIASYEKREAGMLRSAQKYFRGDYIAKHLLQSFLAYTLSFVLILGVVLLYKLDRLLGVANVKEIASWGWKAGAFYFAGLILFELLTAVIYDRRYSLAQKKLAKHLSQMDKLKKRYDIQERQRILSKEGGRNA
jgi:hypothetical protein